MVVGLFCGGGLHDRFRHEVIHDVLRRFSLFDRTLRIFRPLAVLAAAAVVAALAVPAGLSAADASRPTQATAVAGHRPAHHAASEAKGKPRFPGHQPGRIYLGMSCGELCHQKVPQLGRSFGVHRWFKKWGNWHGVAEAIQEDRRNHRRPWISIEGPDRGAATGWRDVGRGRYDRDIRELAKTLRANDQRARLHLLRSRAV